MAGGPAIKSERNFMTAWAPLQICRKYFVLTSETKPLAFITDFLFRLPRVQGRGDSPLPLRRGGAQLHDSLFRLPRVQGRGDSPLPLRRGAAS